MVVGHVADGIKSEAPEGGQASFLGLDSAECISRATPGVSGSLESVTAWGQNLGASSIYTI